MVTPHPTVEVRRQSRVTRPRPRRFPIPLTRGRTPQLPPARRATDRSGAPPSSSLGFIGSDPSSRCPPRSQQEDEEMSVPRQEVAAADTAQPMEGTVRSYLICCFTSV